MFHAEVAHDQFARLDDVRNPHLGLGHRPGKANHQMVFRMGVRLVGDRFGGAQMLHAHLAVGPDPETALLLLGSRLAAQRLHVRNLQECVGIHKDLFLVNSR